MTDPLPRIALVAAAALAAAGCAEKKPVTHAVAGTVKVGPRLLEFGVIRFAPDGGAGAPRAANVTDGRYSVADLPPGNYRVSVEAMAAVPTADGSASSDTKAAKAPPPPAVPEKYKTGVPVEVAGDNPALDFDLSK